MIDPKYAEKRYPQRPSKKDRDEAESELGALEIRQVGTSDHVCQGKACLEENGYPGNGTYQAFILDYPAAHLCKSCVRRWRKWWKTARQEGSDGSKP